MHTIYLSSPNGITKSFLMSKLKLHLLAALHQSTIHQSKYNYNTIIAYFEFSVSCHTIYAEGLTL